MSVAHNGGRSSVSEKIRGLFVKNGNSDHIPTIGAPGLDSLKRIETDSRLNTIDNILLEPETEEEPPHFLPRCEDFEDGLDDDDIGDCNGALSSFPSGTTGSTTASWPSEYSRANEVGAMQNPKSASWTVGGTNGFNSVGTTSFGSAGKMATNSFESAMTDYDYPEWNKQWEMGLQEGAHGMHLSGGPGGGMSGDMMGGFSGGDMSFTTAYNMSAGNDATPPWFAGGGNDAVTNTQDNSAALQAQAAELDAMAAQLMAQAYQAKAQALRMQTNGAGQTMPGMTGMGYAMMNGQQMAYGMQWGAMQQTGHQSSHTIDKPTRRATQESGPSKIKDSDRTTVMLRNLPNDYTRGMLVDLLDDNGFKCHYDFVYLPMDFKRKAGLGYAFVNMCTPADARNVFDKLQGFTEWKMFCSSKVLEVAWGDPLQGLHPHVERYRNSPVMHEEVPDEFRPLLFKDGERIEFPAPTRKLRAPRVKGGRGPDIDEGDVQPQ